MVMLQSLGNFQYIDNVIWFCSSSDVVIISEIIEHVILDGTCRLRPDQP